MTAITYRLATPDDALAIANLIEHSYRGESAARGWTNETAILTGPRTSAEEVARLMGESDVRFLTAWAGGALAATALLRREGTGAYFGMFAVAPEMQTQGLGKAVMTQAELAVRELWDAKVLSLSVISLRDELISWYERRGFVRTGQRMPFPFHAGDGALRHDFDLIVLQKPL